MYKTIAIPPKIALTYQITNSSTFALSSHANTITRFVTWGSDFRSQEAIETTGTYCIKGPVLVDPSEYDITVAIIDQDNKILANPLVSTFIILPKQNTTRINPSTMTQVAVFY